jgi:hypothetical protein
MTRMRGFDPFWKGVADIEAHPEEAVVRFHEGLEPRDLRSGDSVVECHLHDPDALERARELAGRP